MKKILIIIAVIFFHFSLSSQVKTEIEGGLKIGNTSLLNDGIIRFTGADFEGRSNGLWHSLTNLGSSHWSISNNNLFNNNSGYVGIGVADPIELLEVNSFALINNRNERGPAMLKLSRGHAGRDAALVSFGQNDTYLWNVGLLYNGGSLTPNFYISQANRIHSSTGALDKIPNLTITQAGNVGVATANPTSKFHVSLLEGNVGIFEGSAKPHYLGINVNSPAQLDARGHLRFFSDGALQSQVYTAYNEAHEVASLYFRTFSPHSDITFQPNSQSKISIDGSSGYLGLGTIEPTQMLHLANGGRILMEHGETKTYFNSYTAGDGASAILQIDPNATNSSAVSEIRLFRSVNSTGNQNLTIFRGNNTLHWNHTLSSKGDTYLSRLSGKVIIGGAPTTPGNYKLYVDGGILAEEVKVALSNASDWADDAFEKTPVIKDVESLIKEKSHLVDMPSADFLVENGYNLREMDANLLQQVEWLWMHMIEMKKENKALQERISQLESNKD